ERPRVSSSELAARVGRYEGDVLEPATRTTRIGASRLILAGFGLALVGQLFLGRHSAIEGMVLYVVALTLVWRGLRATDSADSVSATSSETAPVPFDWAPAPGRRWSRQARLALAFLVPLEFLGFGGNRITAGGMLTLLLAVGAYLYVFWSRPTRVHLPAAPRWLGPEGIQVRLSTTTLLLLAIFALAFAFRFYRLSDVPSDMNSDHAEKYIDIQDIQGGARPIFFPRNTGREGTEFYLASLLTGLTGYSYLTLKLVMATASLAELPFIYLLGREIGGQRVGLAAAFLVAISKWDVSVGRHALRASFAALFSAIALYLLYRALRRRDQNTLLVLGLVLGLGLYGYTSFRIVLVFVPIVVATFAFLDPELRDHRPIIARQTLVAYGLMALIALPLVRYAFDFPQEFLFRSATRVTAAEQGLSREPITIFAGNVWNAALMFNWQGEHNWVKQVPDEPALDWVSGALFAVGVAAAVSRGSRRRDVTCIALLAGLFVLTLPSTLALAFPIENPSLGRADSVIPVVMVLAAIGLDRAMLAVGGAFQADQRGRTAAVAAGVLAIAALHANYQSYFNDYAPQYTQNTQNEREVAAVIRGYAELKGSDQSAHLAVWPYWVDHRIVALELGDFAWKDHAVVDPIENASAQVSQPGPKLFILKKEDEHSLAVLRSLFPQGIVQEHLSAKAGKDFRSFFVPG
ncbi:MAG TPA: glycosyltransferase family 39 protein, partial [Chloroflexota bacterium]